MPVNKQIGNLWFDTQDEIDRYDELMVSNIELKEGENSDDVNYTYICPRAKKEVMPSYRSEKFLKTQREFLNTKLDPSKPATSYSYFHEWPVVKYTFGVAAGYLLLRELPIRNFYARASIMFFWLLGIRDVFQFKGITKELHSNIVIQAHPGY